MFIFKVFLYLKNLSVGRARAEDGITVALQNDQLTIQSTLNLKKGDRVWVQIDRISPGAFLYDSGAHFTHFTGFMLEDEIVASLWDIFLKYKKMIVHWPEKWIFESSMLAKFIQL